MLTDLLQSIVDITDSNLNTPLILAASAGRQKAARILLKAREFGYQIQELVNDRME